MQELSAMAPGFIQVNDNPQRDEGDEFGDADGRTETSFRTDTLVRVGPRLDVPVLLHKSLRGNVLRLVRGPPNEPVRRRPAVLAPGRDPDGRECSELLVSTPRRPPVRRPDRSGGGSASALYSRTLAQRHDTPAQPA